MHWNPFHGNGINTIPMETNGAVGHGVAEAGGKVAGMT